VLVTPGITEEANEKTGDFVKRKDQMAYL